MFRARPREAWEEIPLVSTSTSRLHLADMLADRTAHKQQRVQKCFDSAVVLPSKKYLTAFHPTQAFRQKIFADASLLGPSGTIGYVSAGHGV